ncbi:MAG: tRNA pseudouridine(55) synthase TruB [Flavobacteriaceae bacterium]|nr:tRNA pseudouridine(55) synthase TruB [Flavobacteriaceae bacterium]|tara:strand:- start:1180 stop:1890 length:711 start_codon:yes stop_codon:yes gene_type:complete
MVYSKQKFLEGSIILVKKPLKWTSFQVVNKIRWLIKNHFNIKKIKVGHAGTLDPLAEGLLIICTGQLTKRITEFQNLNKSYTGVFHIGATRPSFDLETDIDSSSCIKLLKVEDILKTKDQFIGNIQQTPPIFSAVKIKGKKLYQYARAGEKINPKKRNISIFKFNILKIDLPKVFFEIECSKGTYIRSIANDFGKQLKVGAYLENLTRTNVGSYCLEKAISIDDFEKKLEASLKSQ